jgi:glycine betaine/choline ABC-type transport system substrate-binding protein
MKAIVFLLLAAALLSSCSRSNAIVVGSKNFTEQIILGEIAAQQIERKTHLPVERRLNLGGTLLAHEALRKGDIDLYPEYTGTAATGVLKKTGSADPARSYIEVKEEYNRRFQLVWLPPLGFNNTFAMVVRSADARALAAPRLSDASGRAWRLGMGYEFLTRPDGLRRLDQTYHLRWRDTPVSMDLGLLYQALRQQHIDMAAANSTDAMLTNPAYTVLDDDRHAFPSYSACYVLRAEISRDRPAVELALTMLSSHIDAQTMRALNRRVDLEHVSVERVAHDFLAGQP